LKLDFLRHIANPLIDKYVEEGKLSPRDAIEVKKALYRAEEKYKFSIYGGSPLNLARYFESKDFEELIQLLKSMNIVELLFDLLGKIEEAYPEYKELIDKTREVKEKYLSKPLVETSRQEEEKKCIEIDDLVKLVEEYLKPENIYVEKNIVKAVVKGGVEVDIGLYKQHIKVVVKINRNTIQTPRSILVKVADIAEKTLCI